MIKSLQEKHSGLFKSISVMITPPLISLCLFFLVGFYDDQKEIKVQQNLILVELGKISTKGAMIEENLSKFESSSNNEISKVSSKCDENSSEILSIWKTLSK